MAKVLAIVTLLLLVLTAGCGFSIHYGGESFQNAIKGHMILGVLTIVSIIALIITIFIG
ncbi:hypothetical protein EDC18_10284 [Natranaerovirga pectinivora]|uniref:Uncharacterized protein n=1 Tax=Natranaerovirga pectinivora TaxID=682400 RepID=A0A4R3MRN5_9FIRM|nr:hypothetical protein [Natranaerovirga pectinivora]TCT16068.1 hypothetical protein EDC18_10284 [Natranaerovirga pectinivora]